MVISIGMAYSLDDVPRNEIKKVNIVFTKEIGVSDLNWLRTDNPDVIFINETTDQVYTYIPQRGQQSCTISHQEISNVIEHKDIASDVICTSVTRGRDNFKHRSCYLSYAWSKHKDLIIINTKGTSHIFNNKGDCLFAKDHLEWEIIKFDYIV